MVFKFFFYFCINKNKKDEVTEEHIKTVAKRLFFKEGKFNATTQEIAQAAEVNRTLINYYFRSRDNLFNLIFEEATKQEELQREIIFSSGQPFKEKIQQFIIDSLQTGREYPYLETYIVTKINEGNFYKETMDWTTTQKKFKDEFDAEVQKGVIDNIPCDQFILNLASLVSFPIALKPLFQAIFKLSDEKYEEILEERKELIMKMIFKK